MGTLFWKYFEDEFKELLWPLYLEKQTKLEAKFTKEQKKKREKEINIITNKINKLKIRLVEEFNEWMTTTLLDLSFTRVIFAENAEYIYLLKFDETIKNEIDNKNELKYNSKMKEYIKIDDPDKRRESEFILRTTVEFLSKVSENISVLLSG